MPLARVLEPEGMDSDEEARDYDAMDHAGVNGAFCDDLLAVGPALDAVLDVGTGTARIPIALCERRRDARVIAVDLARSMLAVAAENVARAGLAGAVTLQEIDAKRLPFPGGAFSVVMSNSIIHHVPAPETALGEMVRVLRPGGWLFVRDLRRPDDDATVAALVATYAANETPAQRALLDASLRASLTIDEVAARVTPLGVDGHAVRTTSDRHWTLAWRKPAGGRA
jgi:ubiquinone/menaquinone biosynthesis C-methylase UbiE